MSSPLSGAEKRLRKRQRWQKQRDEYVAENPTPYARWQQLAGDCRAAVTTALAANTVKLEWRKGKTERTRLLTVEDLAIGLWAVLATGEKGLAYGQLNCCFKVCCGTGCHRAKAAALLASLQNLALIRKTAKYSVGRKGNVFEAVRKELTEKDAKEWLDSVSHFMRGLGKS